MENKQRKKQGDSAKKSKKKSAKPKAKPTKTQISYLEIFDGENRPPQNISDQIQKSTERAAHIGYEHLVCTVVAFPSESEARSFEEMITALVDKNGDAPKMSIVEQGGLK